MIIKLPGRAIVHLYQTEAGEARLYVSWPRFKAEYVVLDREKTERWLKGVRTIAELEYVLQNLEAHRAVAPVKKERRRVRPLYQMVLEILDRCEGYVTIDELVEMTEGSVLGVKNVIRRHNLDVIYVLKDGRKKVAVLCRKRGQSDEKQSHLLSSSTS